MQYNNYLQLISILSKLVPLGLSGLLPKKLRYLQESNAFNPSGLYREILAINGESVYTKMFKAEFLASLMDRQAKFGRSESKIDKGVYNLESITDYLEYLPGDVLAKVDLTSMYSSVEARSPLLDYRIAELGLSIHSSRRVGKNKTKIALREAYTGHLPNYILSAKKRGFTVPLSYWLTPAFKNYASQLLLENSHLCQIIFNKSALEKYLFAAFKGKDLNPRHIWNLVMLENWFRLNR